MRDSRQRSAAADGRHGQGIKLQNSENSKGKGPDPELYTSDQLEQLQVPRLDRPDVASESLDRRVLNTSQPPNLPGSQLSGVDNVDSASNPDATFSTSNTHQRVSRRNQLPDSQLSGNQPVGGQLPGGQLPGGELSSRPPPGSQFSALNNHNSASKVSAIGRTQTTAQGAESSLSQIPSDQLPHRQAYTRMLAAMDDFDSFRARRFGKTSPALETSNQLPHRQAYTRMLAAIDDFDSFRARRFGITRPAFETAEAPRTQFFHIWAPEHLLPRNRIIPIQSPVVDNVDPASQTSTMRSIVKKHRDFYNTKAGDSGMVLQPKRYHPVDFRLDSRKDAKGTSPSTEPASTQPQVDSGSSEHSNTQLQSKTYHPVKLRSDSQKDAKGPSPSTIPASAKLHVESDSSQHSETQLQSKTYHPAEGHPDSGKNLGGTSPSIKAASGQRGSDLNQEHSASSSTNSLTVKPLNIVKMRGAQQFVANPPQAQLPPLPTQRPSLLSNAEVSSLASSYGDTASLLNLSVQEDVNVEESGASRYSLILERGNGKASSSASPGNVERNTQSNNELLTPPNEIRFRPSSTLDTSNLSSGRVSIIDSNGSVHSRPLSVHEAGVLEHHIKAAMRHVECISGDSTRSSVFATFEEAGSGNGHDDQTSNPSAELILDLGPGGSQSGSSHGPLSHSASGQSGGEGCEFLSRCRSSGGSSEGTAAMATRTDYRGDEERETGISPIDRTNAIESRGRGRIVGEMDEEGGIVVNPETVDENRRIPRQTHLYTLARLTGSSVAGFTSSAEGSEDEGTRWTTPSQREDRRRYTRPSCLETDEQSGNLILRPEYTFTGGAGFPHRAALTPSQANLFLNNLYQHPTPLSSDHVHPFRSSPPLINRAGASQHSYTRSETSDGSLPMDDEDYVLKPNTYSGQHTYLRANTYSGQHTYLRANTYSCPDRNLRADTYSNPDLYLQPNTYTRPERCSRDTYSRRGRGVYQSEVDENLASGSRSNEDQMRYHQREARFVSSPTGNALDDFYGSSSRMRTHDEGIDENKEYQEFIKSNSKLAKMLRGHSKPEVTRNPMRTGMHENENSLAAYDHSFTQFHTNRYQPYLNYENRDQQQSLPHTHHQTSSQGRVGANRPQLYLPYRETSWGFSSPREYGFTHDMLRAHRRQLAAANLFPRAFTPPTPNRHLSPLHLASLIFSSTPSGGSSIRADGPAGPSSGPTSLPPLCGGAQPERRRFVPAPHLIPNRRASAAVLNRQRNLGAVIITVMGVCPPLLLIVGLGGMDPTMASAMRGEVAGFTEAQKKVALGLGVGGTLGVLLGAIGAIIYLVLHP